MKLRWKDRIEILSSKSKIYDPWGHPLPSEWVIIGEHWAQVRPILSSSAQALVTVRIPFKYEDDIQINWRHKKWLIIQGPAEFPDTGVVQFKIEELL